MKKVIGIILIALITFSCKTAQFSSTGDKEKKFISDFLSCMSKDNGPKYKEMMDCISPKYIKDNNINVTNFKVDNYTLWGYSIESYTKGGMITAKVWGQNREWVHLLTFKLSKEGGKTYLVPSEHSDTYISPWWERKTYIKEK
jgi:hypothetical protein